MDGQNSHLRMDDVVGQTTYQPGAGVGVCWGVLSNPKTSMKPECSQTFFRNMEDSFWSVCPLIGSPSQSRAAMSIRTAMSKMNISFIEYFGSSRAAFAIDCRFQAVMRMLPNSAPETLALGAVADGVRPDGQWSKRKAHSRGSQLGTRSVPLGDDMIMCLLEHISTLRCSDGNLALGFLGVFIFHSAR